MEILVTSVTPFQLLFGKIVGLGLLGLTQLVIWMVGGLRHAARWGSNTDALSAA